MILRFTVISLIVLNLLLWGWASLQPEPAHRADLSDPAHIRQISDVPAIRLAGEASRLPPGGSQAGRRCYTLGPLISRAVMQNIHEQLARSVVQLSWHEGTVVVEQGFWVYLEPFGSYEQAADAVEQLVSHGVVDYYLVPSGPYANAVSVGLYERESQAVVRKEAIEALGLGWPVMMEMQRKDVPRYWLDFEIRPDSNVQVGSLPTGSPEAQSLEVPCSENQASFPPT